MANFSKPAKKHGKITMRAIVAQGSPNSLIPTATAEKLAKELNVSMQPFFATVGNINTSGMLSLEVSFEDGRNKVTFKESFLVGCLPFEMPLLGSNIVFHKRKTIAMSPQQIQFENNKNKKVVIPIDVIDAPPAPAESAESRKYLQKY